MLLFIPELVLRITLTSLITLLQPHLLVAAIPESAVLAHIKTEINAYPAAGSNTYQHLCSQQRETGLLVLRSMHDCSDAVPSRSNSRS